MLHDGTGRNGRRFGPQYPRAEAGADKAGRNGRPDLLLRKTTLGAEHDQDGGRSGGAAGKALSRQRLAGVLPENDPQVVGRGALDQPAKSHDVVDLHQTHHAGTA